MHGTTTGNAWNARVRRAAWVLCIVSTAGCRRSEESWEPAPLPANDAVVTAWGDALDRREILPEYPRPTLVRERWMNLNGSWQFEPGGAEQPPRGASGTLRGFPGTHRCATGTVRAQRG